MFRLLVLLQDTFGANQTPPRWYSMITYLPVCLSIDSTINPDPKSSSIWRNAAQNIQENFTLPYCCPQTLIIIPLSSTSTNNLPSATAKYFNILCVHDMIAWPCLNVGALVFFFFFLAATLPWRPFQVRLLQTVDGYTWISQGFCPFRVDGTTRHLLISKGNKLNMSFIWCGIPIPLSVSV